MNSNRKVTPIDHSHRPSQLLFWSEVRAIYDAAGMLPMFALKRFLPAGDGQPVLVLPGFLASSRSTRPLRNFIAALGYKTHRWKLGYNTWYSLRLHYGMRDRVTELAERYGEAVSLIGWSLGGVYAREPAPTWGWDSIPGHSSQSPTAWPSQKGHGDRSSRTWC